MKFHKTKQHVQQTCTKHVQGISTVNDPDKT